jgi:predicted O-linked N-acetylglucosamine transferase (SPINDLY family)
MREAFPLYRDGRVAQAEGLLERILALEPDYADALHLLGEIRAARGELERAIELARAATRSNPREPEFSRALARHLGRLGLAQDDAGDPGRAAASFREALDADPDSIEALNNLGRALRVLGRAEDALAVFRELHRRLPGNAETLSNVLFTLNLVEACTPEEIYREHLRFDQLYGAGRFGLPRRAARDPQPGRRLRVGYVSPDFRLHAVSYFIEPVLRHHERAGFDVHCYHCHPRSDDMTAHLRSLAAHWSDCAASSDDELAARIEADGIDILVDLAGHTAWNRLLVFARRPAPVQATWLGYLNTTGLSAMDYRITDAFADPPGIADRLHRERLVRLPASQWCYARPAQRIDPGPLPALQAGRVRFGSFNKAAKLSTRVLELWSGMLRELPASSLLLAGVPRSEWARIAGFLGERGVAAERLELHEPMPLEAFRALHQRVDLALDAYPYSGATTTCDSLWMGVPTLTRAGDTSISRSSASLLEALGLESWVARTDAEFLRRARSHAADLPALAALRAGLRARMERSPLMDAARFTRDLEQAYRTMWGAACADA